MRRSIICGCAMLLGSCQQPASQTAANPDMPSARLVEPNWVQVTANGENRKIYVNAMSIYPYKSMRMAEIAVEVSPKYTAFSMAFDCNSRLQSNLGADGSATSPAPVQSWLVYAPIYNFVCFKVVDAPFNKLPAVKYLDIDAKIGVPAS
jgi:hypothetical protein